jgi:hypothetical protein
MTVKGIVFAIGCALTWLVLLPLLFGGVIALFGYAVLEELTELLIGRDGTSPDNSTAREIAALICSRFAR